MARPTKPKDVKPGAEGAPEGAAPAAAAGGGGGLDLKFIITLVVVVLSTTLTSAASIYFLAPMVVMPPLEKQLKEIAKNAGKAEEGEHGEHGGNEHDAGPGMNLELDEFTVNLKEDPSLPGAQYLRAKMSLSVMVPPAENCYALGEHHAMAVPAGQLSDGGRVLGAAAAIEPISGKHYIDSTLLASGGGGEDPAVACANKFKSNMAKFVPTMRDVINAALMKRTAGSLSTLEGQEALKDEVKESINQFMGDQYQVSRVNFEDFIIQK